MKILKYSFFACLASAAAATPLQTLTTGNYLNGSGRYNASFNCPDRPDGVAEVQWSVELVNPDDIQWVSRVNGIVTSAGRVSDEVIRGINSRIDDASIQGVTIGCMRERARISFNLFIGQAEEKSALGAVDVFVFLDDGSVSLKPHRE